MNSLWNDAAVSNIVDDDLALRVYTSQLLGREPSLVLHGGGNTSVKVRETDLFGRDVDVLYVKGSGWDLATIEKPGFAPVRLDTLLQMAELESLSDTDMVTHQRAAMLNPNAPNPSVEAILHALIPFKYVDHTHADSVVVLTNAPDSEQRLADVYGDRVVLIPYVMPGFILARTVAQIMRDRDWAQVDALILLKHGVFTFAGTARAAYERMIEIVTQAEEHLRRAGVFAVPDVRPPAEPLPSADRLTLARLRHAVAQRLGAPSFARLNRHAQSIAFSQRDDVADIATRGPLTPDHSIRTKRVPAVMAGDPDAAVTAYADAYRDYYEANANGETMLDPAPRWVVWPGRGTVSTGTTVKACRIIEDISNHTMNAITMAAGLGDWQPLAAADIFDVEYWELEQAKLKRAGSRPELAGHVAVVSGAAHGIGRACVAQLNQLGAAVIALDIDVAVESLATDTILAVTCDVTDTAAVDRALGLGIERFGGVDMVVSNVGYFPSSAPIESIAAEAWDRAMAVNLTSHQRLWQLCIPYLKLSLNPSIIVIASKNVPAPGPNAAAYSVAKAGLTQLARVAALELGQHGIRVNVVHPNGVFDTALWSEALLQARADAYGITVEEYKRKNVLQVEVTSADVARMVGAMAGPTFRVTTGAQVAIDGGNERVI